MWNEYLRDRLPLTEDGEVHLRDVEVAASVRGKVVVFVAPEKISVDDIVALFGGILGDTPPNGPLPDNTFSALLARADEIGSELWRQHWERWRSEGRL